ncbi:enoyl-CoA hydratase-related protein [Capillimicrobium parvum]|uniref:2,3-dehydroadipyl-CoA hydratase n=1 Tax=Capillimicrobium parvum TaxID=2884022 RepID=A0A9E6XVH0_9ACTN|nr:enoyl-CoA hydratase-related protein [Capillimicrobium parvum]UGS34853.1 2,3-dehydroadipyl-CoA hydratase [Capillimicrobium parvum]
MHADPVTSPPASAVALSERREGVLILTLNRPEALNAFNRALFDAVREGLEAAAADPQVGCVLVTGSGRAFTAGSDISDDAGPEPEPGGKDPYDAFIECVETFPKPLVAAVNGLAVGIGTTMLGHCELVLAGASARFRMPFTSLGLVPEAGSTSTIPSLMGRQPAVHALLTSSWIPAEEAARTGLVWQLTSDEELLAEALAVCEQIAAQPLESLMSTKRLLLDARLPAARAARDREEPEFRRLTERPAHLEALAAFRERRPPDFRSLLG